MHGGILTLSVFAAGDAEPRRAGPVQVEQERPGGLGQQVKLALRDV